MGRVGETRVGSRVRVRRRGLVAALVAVVLVVSACATVGPGGAGDGAGRGGWRPRLPALRAEPDEASGGRIVDARGREVVLRGVNVNALAEYWQYGPFPTTFPLTEADAEAISGVGWNVVRLLVSWSRVEPEPGRYDDAYLDRVAAAVDLFADRDIYTIVDLHQDAWGPSLAAPPGTDCPADTEPAFGWDGAPAWATLDGGASRCVPLGLRELSPAVRAAFDAFWNDEPGPGGVGIRTRYGRMLGHVARRFAREPAVAGYDVMNEPNALTGEQISALGDFYGEAVAAIRAGEREGHGFGHLVFFEPGVGWSDLAFGTPPDFPRDENVVFAPHIYRGGIGAGPVRPEDFERVRREAARFGGAPVLVGEWGTSPARAADPNDVYFERHQSLQDEHRFSSTLWTWRESCGDPHKAGEARRGAVPFVWGAFEVDCRTNRVVGEREALLDELRRAYVRAAPGRLLDMRYTHGTGGFTAHGRGAAPGEALVAWYPAAEAQVGDIAADGLANVRTRSSGSEDGVYLTGVARGGAWSLTIGPP